MRNAVFALALTLAAAPAFAGGVVLDLPRLTWPQDGQTTQSTKGCAPAPQTASTVCR